MKSFQTLYEDCQSMSSDDDSTTLIFFKSKLNTGIKKCYAVLNAEYFYDEATDLSVASQSSYPLPADAEKIHTIKFTISSVDYVIKEFSGTENQWIALVSGSASTESDYPQYHFIKKNTIEFYPITSTAAYTITYRYKKRTKDLSVADFTTGTIKTAVVGSTALVGNTGTSWTSAMAGRWVNITSDGRDYQIASVTDATNLVFSREWIGTAITAGTDAYTMKECSLLPEDFQELPVNYALALYYRQKENMNLSNYYQGLWDKGLLELKETGSNLTTSGIISEEVDIRNPNDYPLGLS